MPSKLYCVASAAANTYSGAAAALPGAADMSAGVLVKLTEPGIAAELTFGNINGGLTLGWRLKIANAAYATGGVSPTVIVNNNVGVLTVPVAADIDKWLFVVFTRTGTTITLYINGKAVFVATDADFLVTPQGTAPRLVMPASGDVALAAAFYTETLLPATQVAGLFAEVLELGSLVPLRVAHQWSAATSLRPVTSAMQTFADTGSTGGVPLTPSSAVSGLVLDGAFSSAVVPAVTTGLLNAPTAA